MMASALSRPVGGQRRGFGPGEDHNDSAAGSVSSVKLQRRGFGPGEDHNMFGGVVWTGLAFRQRRGFGPGEDHNFELYQAFAAFHAQRRGFGPGEDHNTHAALKTSRS